MTEFKVIQTDFFSCLLFFQPTVDQILQILDLVMSLIPGKTGLQPNHGDLEWSEVKVLVGKVVPIDMVILAGNDDLVEVKSPHQVARPKVRTKFFTIWKF